MSAIAETMFKPLLQPSHEIIVCMMKMQMVSLFVLCGSFIWVVFLISNNDFVDGQLWDILN